MEDGGIVAKHVHFTGIVQGVFFRAHTQREALRLGLKGWVRNLPDGRVEAWAEGDRASVDGLLEYCRTGIPAARVDGMEVREMEPSGDYPSFEIVR